MRCIGAMGSRRAHDHRLWLLRGAGVREQRLTRLNSAIRLALGAHTQETVVSITAKIVAHAAGSLTDPPDRGP
ncbi:hypothetical protein AB0P17_28790 [Streptomyces sp. NPDC088124]|uniref:XdhC family protein n=1 Tax=Streptomyces sp. NPDC088124 TaxID=3154654 RepID=UPI003416C79B